MEIQIWSCSTLCRLNILWFWKQSKAPSSCSNEIGSKWHYPKICLIPNSRRLKFARWRFSREYLIIKSGWKFQFGRVLHLVDWIFCDFESNQRPPAHAVTKLAQNDIFLNWVVLMPISGQLNFARWRFSQECFSIKPRWKFQLGRVLHLVDWIFCDFESNQRPTAHAVTKLAQNDIFLKYA